MRRTPTFFFLVLLPLDVEARGPEVEVRRPHPHHMRCFQIKKTLYVLACFSIYRLKKLKKKINSNSGFFFTWKREIRAKRGRAELVIDRRAKVLFTDSNYLPSCQRRRRRRRGALLQLERSDP